MGGIQNDDTQPALSINDVAQPEGTTSSTPPGTTAFAFTIGRATGRKKTNTVNYATGNVTAIGNASCAGSNSGSPDYISQSSTTLTFAPGETSKPVTVLVCADTAFEPDETFTVTLSGATNATIAKAVGTGTIQNDDTQPALSINDVAQPEGTTSSTPPGTTAFAFTVSLSNASSQTITVNYATGNVTAIGNASCASSNSGSPDYISQSSTTLTFAPGETSKPVTVLVCADTAFEPDETFTVTLSGATNATIAKAVGTGTIQNDDTQPALSINDVAQPEGTTSSTPPGTTAFAFTVSLSNASSQTTTGNYTTGNVTAIGNASCASSNSGSPDYISQSSTTLTFAPGETSKPVTVLVCADTAFELDETFTVTLSGATNATIAKAVGTGTIQNDDTQPALSIDDVVKPEGTTSSTPPGTTAFTFTVSLSNPSSQTITVNYATGNVTAIGNASCASSNSGSPDYISQSTTLTFAPGETSKPVTVLVCADTAFELDETFTVTLSGATNATIVKAVGTGTIQNDDALPPPDLAIAKRPPGPATSATDINYHLTVTNNGLTPSTGGTVTDILPAQVSYKSASAGCGFTAPSTVTCSFGPLAPNLSVSFDITVHISVAAIGTLTNTANVRGNGTETNQANDTATATTVVSPQTTPGKVTGGGVINVTGGTANFGFVAQRKTTGGPASGNLNYLDHATKRHVQGPVTSLTITGNSAEFSGPCGTSCTFTVAVQDKAEPDGSGKDMFYITVNSPAYRAGGVIRSGNIQVHSESPAPAQRETVATGAGEGIFPSGAALNGILLNGLQFGKGVGIPGDSSATGDFQALLPGTSLLGQPQNINVVGRASSGLVNPDGTVTFSGLSTVDMGNGTPPLTGVPFSVTATTQGLQLILGNTPLPMATLTAGSITIQ